MAAPSVEATGEKKNTTHSSMQISKPTRSESGSSDKSTRKPIKTYTRQQLLILSGSPLVQLPSGMPELKDWFGDSEQHAYQKTTDPQTPSSARERRFRRDQEEGDSHPRNNFRPTASQPSQMGNFKHQSLRSNDRDRDRDRDGERDRERDARDKDGLRHLSDKYDRDRLSSHPSSLRAKERDSASHASSAGSNRIGPQSVASGTARRSDTREGHRKKGGDDDWRRDTRSTRDDRSEGGRKDREDRERPRSRVRDPSRSRRDLSTSRRDRDDHRREKDVDRDNDDDPRHWRDDGRRDERMATRRVERQAERERERDRHREREPAWENSGDRRWASADDRSKRGNGRDKRQDEGRDRDTRGEREKEKEPAWMETYVPTPGSGTGILGSKTEGELDGIQAWKKERKEKEQREQEAALSANAKAGDLASVPSGVPIAEDEKPLDEIQLFKMLMKKEEGKKKVESPQPAAPQIDSAIVSSSATSTKVDSLANTAPKPPLSLLNTKEASHTSTMEASANEPLAHAALKPQDSTTQQVPPSASIGRSDGLPVNTQFTPPVGSRLLAFARASQKTQNSLDQQPFARSPPTKSSPDPTQQLTARISNLQPFTGFSPFDEQQRLSFPSGIEAQRDHPADQTRQPQEQRSFTPIEQNIGQEGSGLDNLGLPINKGSRFARFFDGKTKDVGPPMLQHPGHISHSTSPGPGITRQNHDLNHLHNGPPDLRTMDDIYAMLSNSGQGNRGAPQAPPLSAHAPFNRPTQHNLHLLQQQIQHQQHQPISTNQLEPLYESRLDDRNFVPDGMVPGLRTTAPRAREPAGMFNDVLDEGLHFENRRLPLQRTPEAHFSGIPSNLYSHPGLRNGNVPIQQSHYRGGPSPISHQHGLHPQQQRLPPGLANLGGRPPHETSQLLGMPGLHGALPVNGSGGQQHFNGGFPPNGSAGFGGPQMRGPLHPPNAGPQQIAGHLNMELRGNNQNHQFGGVGPLGGSLRANGFPGQPGSGVGGQLLGSLPPMRQQPQPQYPPGMMPQIPPQMHQQSIPSQTSQQSHDLMALLMGGSHRE